MEDLCEVPTCRRNQVQVRPRQTGHTQTRKTVLSVVAAMTAVHKSLDQQEKELILLHDDEAVALEAPAPTSSWFSWLFPQPQQPRFTKLTDIAYPSLSGIQSERHKLDIYIPTSAMNNTNEALKLPVFIHIHGGGWVRGASSLPKSLFSLTFPAPTPF